MRALRTAGRVLAWLNANPHRREWVALLPPLAALGAQWLLWPLMRPYAWFLFYPAVFASSWIGGKAAGLRATALSVPLVWWVFIAPQFSLANSGYGPVLPVLGFIAMGVVFSLSLDRLRRSEQRLRALFEHAGEGIFVADIEGRYTHVNGAGCRMLGYELGDIVGKTILDLIPQEEAHRLALAKELLQTGQTQVAEWSLRRKDGRYLPVEVSATILPGGQWLGFVRDISERRLAQAQLSQAAKVFDSTNEAIIIADARRRIISVNQAFTSITGFSAEEVIGKDPRLQSSGRHDAAFYRTLWASLSETGQWQGEVWNRRKNGEIYPVWENISAIKDANGRVTHYVAVLSDITPIKRAEERLIHLAHHDALTGLPNRLFFANSLQLSLERAKRHQRKLALLFIDLDRFKLINDSLGHAAGDELLLEIGRRLKATVRGEDLVTRLGGDEFTVALEEIGHAEDAAELARKIINEISRPMRLAGHDVVVSASVGIALYPDDATTVEDLTRVADSAMYRAKEHGRGIHEFYTPDITQQVVEHLALETGLRQALARDELRLFYQPQFDTSSREIVGVEALLRWQHPVHGLILPERFIAVAEDSDLINAIGTWVLRQACAQARAWLDQGLAPVRIAVNISGRHIVRDHLIETVNDALHENRLRSSDADLELEITESVLQTVERSAVVLQRLRSLGLRIAIDDFGTGYSSLSMLKHLPIDTLKIDRIFVRHIPDDRDSQAIVRAMISMAHTLGLRVVAEGVETEQQLAFLQTERCDEVQGFLLGKACSAQAMTQLLRTRRPAPRLLALGE